MKTKIEALKAGKRVRTETYDETLALQAALEADGYIVRIHGCQGLTVSAVKTSPAARPATVADAAAWLTDNDFTFEGKHGRYSERWYRKDRVRVVLEDENCFAVYAFDQRGPLAGCVAWDTRITGAPLAAVAAIITTALASVTA